MKSSSSSGRRWWRSRNSAAICCSAGAMASFETAEHMMKFSQSIPEIFFCTVV